MSSSPCQTDLERFRTIVARRLGLHFDETRFGVLQEVLGRRLDARRQTATDYLEWLDSPLGGSDVRVLAAELTVTETYFFRNTDQFRALARQVLPSRMIIQSASRRLQLLTVGCSSGEEAYSLAIVARENLPEPSWSVSIRAVDLNPAMIDKARRGLYSLWSLRETPPDIRSRWFRQEGNGFMLDDIIKRAVDFEERNLAEESPDLWRPHAYDVVFCRNLLMYFTTEQARVLVERIAGALAPGGYLFLGHAETLRGLSHDFHLEHTHGTFYYRRRTRPETDHERTNHDKDLQRNVHPQVRPPDVNNEVGLWVDVIGRATHRIQTLTDTIANAIASDVRPHSPTWDLTRSLDLLTRERYHDALELIHALPPESADDPEVLLLRAVLLTHSGQFKLAETVCKELLRFDELNSGAHYLLALCREAHGDRNGAIEEDQIAAYLDPTFAMPRLHLGLLARRAGEFTTAAIEFRQALGLLQQEEPSRLVFFGGGFGRSALVALCEAELHVSGGIQ